MNEQLQQALVTIITKATEGVEASVSFLSSEVPDVVSQLIIWKIASNSMTVAFCLGLFLLGCWVFKKTFVHPQCEGFFWEKKHQPRYYEGEDQYEITVPAVLIVFVSAIICIILFFTFLGSTYELLQLIIAPKIYLIEYASNLVK